MVRRRERPVALLDRARGRSSQSDAGRVVLCPRPGHHRGHRPVRGSRDGQSRVFPEQAGFDRGEPESCRHSLIVYPLYLVELADLHPCTRHSSRDHCAAEYRSSDLAPGTDVWVIRFRQHSATGRPVRVGQLRRGVRAGRVLAAFSGCIRRNDCSLVSECSALLLPDRSNGSVKGADGLSGIAPSKHRRRLRCCHRCRGCGRNVPNQG